MNICELLENNTQQPKPTSYEDDADELGEKLIKEKLTISSDRDDGSADSQASHLPSVEVAAESSSSPPPHRDSDSASSPASSSSSSQSEFNYYLIEQLKNEPNESANSTTNREDHSPYFSNSPSSNDEAEAEDEETDFNTLLTRLSTNSIISDQQQQQRHELNDYKNVHHHHHHHQSQSDEQENSLSGLLSAPVQERNNENNGGGEGGSDQRQHYQQQQHQFQQSDYTQSNDSANDYGLGSSTQSIEDELSYGPFEKLCKLCEDPTPMNIETAPKYLVGALEFSTTQEDYMRVFAYLRKYCCYSDILLRSYWLEQIQSVMQYIHQESENIAIEFTNGFSMTEEVLSLIGELVREQTYQVKKCAISSILYLVEKRLIDNNQIEEKIIPNLLFLLNESNDDFHVDCISIFGKLAPLVGRNITTERILKPFCNLCSSSVFHTRKACAANMADIANAISAQDVERELLPHFCELMRDQVWAIRKICADTFSTFAGKCSRKTRIEVLTPCFTKLLDDHSRWVKLSAYKTLGPFIVTFLNEKNQEPEPKSPQPCGEKESATASGQAASDESSNADEYSDFMYWRNSLPKLDEDASNSDKSPSTPTSNVKDGSAASSNPNSNISIYSSSGSLNIYSQLQQEHQEQLEQKAFDINELSETLKQDIVPPILLSYYISMVDPNGQNSLDAEMNYNCAYNFPAIALTLGQSNWKYLSALYKKLAEDLNWKVRQTLAYSLHELAQILGTEYTQTDLVPIFESYTKDVDEVRIGIISNLAKFLKLLNDEHRRAFLPDLITFVKLDNQRNWRSRHELGLQIIDFCPLFPVDSIAEYIQPVAFQLAVDKIAEVRLTGIKALSEILKQFKLSKSVEHRKNFVADVIRAFANSTRWSFRQLYAYLCETILTEDSDLSIESFSNDFVPKLLSFRNDKVPNVRITLAHVLVTKIINNDFFRSAKCPIRSELQLTIKYLKNDTDTDVKSKLSDDASFADEEEADEDEEDETEDDEVDETKLKTNLNKSSQLKIVNFETEELENDQCY